MSTGPTAKNISRVRWFDQQGRLRGFQSSRCYGVIAADGRLLAMRKQTNGPSVWDTLNIARQIAPHADDMVTDGNARWITPHDWL